MAHLGEIGSDGTSFIEGGHEGGNRKRGNEEFAANSAKMRRIMLTSKMLPQKRQDNDGATAGSSKPRGRPRKSETDGLLGPMIRVIKVEDENGEFSVLERPGGRRAVRKPKRFVGQGIQQSLIPNAH